ncbi:cytochrome b [Rhizorhabdus dicambivorans]|uniref:Cytochrome b n=1 Tax=Rhizorhabdus dicambivorans TaxID=1850238 RepID=A0A2A4FYS9_9SPHN|nr:cytochrome b [Rhizorhabdus dicambivorans]ATE63754.1 cytochrome b [Rhizorhabdus dicambivorans]PCE42885.1 cytochrome b [Rhizorhabdus dicambivorans]
MTEAQLHYNAVARRLHWTIGTLVIVNILFGILHDPLGKLFPVMPIHKSIGLLVLALSLFRLFWRITHPAPPLPASVGRVQAVLAHGLHWIFYALMLILPITGWIFSSAGDRPLSFFWLFDVPKFAVEKGSPLAQGTHNAHELFGIAWAVLIIGHVGAALYHHYVQKDGVLSRMWRGAPGA